MALTPLDAEKARFRQVFRGYGREEVEAFRAAVIAALEEQIGRTEQLTDQVAELERQLKRYRESEELLKNSVVLAQRTCDELIAAAHKKADAIRQDARSDGERLRLELAELRAQREQFEYAFHGLLSGFLHRLEQGNPRLAAVHGEVRELSSAAEQGEAESADIVVSTATEPGAGPEAVPTAPFGAGGGESQRLAPGPAGDAETPQVPLPQPPPVSGVPSAPRDPRGSEATAGRPPERDADIAEFAAAVEAAEYPPSKEWPQPTGCGTARSSQREVDVEVSADATADIAAED
jgi:DivIVA domain-containing protein